MPELSTRTTPRQNRSAGSIEQILDAAEVAFVARGYDAVTMGAIAEQTGVSIGRVYYWFATKESIARSLAERNERLIVDLFAPMLVDDPGMSTPALIESIVARTLEAARTRPSVLMQLGATPSTADATGATSLVAVVHAGVAALVTGRVPGTSDREAGIVAATMIGTVVAGLRSIGEADARGDHDVASAMTTELIYVISAYLACRFPATDNPLLVVGPARSASPTTRVPDTPFLPYSP